jgi:aromatic ring hydroxylase
MALRTVAQYRESLRDGRVVFYRGQRVPNVTGHPVIRVAIEHASIDYEMAERPETRPYLERYLGGARGVPAEHRLRLMNLIQDLTASDFGGSQAVLAIHAEGSIEAEKLATFRAYNPKPAVAYAKRLASIPEVQAWLAPASVRRPSSGPGR